MIYIILYDIPSDCCLLFGGQTASSQQLAAWADRRAGGDPQTPTKYVKDGIIVNP